MSLMEKLYWSMPYSIKCLMASQKARQESELRFGEDYQRLKQEIAGRNNWTVEQFREYQLERLRELIAHCAAHVPYYRELFKRIGLEPGDIKTLEDIRGIPILEKNTICERSDEMIDDRMEKHKLICGNTSGTTGTPMQFYRDVGEFSTAFAYNAVRHWSVAGVERIVNRSVSIGGSLVASPNRSRPPFWVLNRTWKQLYMSSYHLTPKFAPYYVEAIRKWMPDYIEAYPSSVFALAKLITEGNLPAIPLKAVFTTAENLFDHQREAIAKAFSCKAFSQYGCTEQVAYAAECANQGMHLSPDHSIVEIVDDNDQNALVGQVGHVVGTSLEKLVQPLIRYRVGDNASLSDRTCSCGCRLPLLEAIEGRTDSGLLTRDGRRIPQIINYHVFSKLKNIVEGQIVQDTLDDYRIRLVPAPEYTESVGRQAMEKFLERVGNQANVTLEVVNRIERTKNGKFQAVVCNLSQEIKDKYLGK